MFVKARRGNSMSEEEETVKQKEEREEEEEAVVVVRGGVAVTYRLRGFIALLAVHIYIYICTSSAVHTHVYRG